MAWLVYPGLWKDFVMAPTRAEDGDAAVACSDGPSFGFGVFCGEDINASGARFAETKNPVENPRRGDISCVSPDLRYKLCVTRFLRFPSCVSPDSCHPILKEGRYKLCVTRFLRFCTRFWRRRKRRLSRRRHSSCLPEEFPERRVASPRCARCNQGHTVYRDKPDASGV